MVSSGLKVMTMRVAIIDMGTNTFHLMIAENVSGVRKIIHRERQAVKLGQAGINEGRITPEALERAVACLAGFQATLESYQATTTLAFGTSALRNAANAAEVVARISAQTGISTRIISGDLEADLIYRGVQFAMNLGTLHSLIMDIGGGSVEFIIGNHHAVVWKRSLEIGAQRLLERFHRHDPIAPQEIADLDHFFSQALVPVFEALQHYQPDVLVGSSGTFDTLSDIYCLSMGLARQPDASETPLTLPGFFKIHHELIGRNRTERMQIPGMIEMRVDMIVVACCMIRYLIERHAFRDIRVSSYALKEGVLATL